MAKIGVFGVFPNVGVQNWPKLYVGKSGPRETPFFPAERVQILKLGIFGHFWAFFGFWGVPGGEGGPGVGGSKMAKNPKKGPRTWEIASLSKTIFLKFLPK